MGNKGDFSNEVVQNGKDAYRSGFVSDVNDVFVRTIFGAGGSGVGRGNALHRCRRFRTRNSQRDGAIAKEGAKMSAIQAAQDQAGIYVSSLSVMKDSALSQDEIATIVSDVVRIDDKNIKYETSILGDSDVQVVKYRASVTVYIDTDSLKKNIDAWRHKEEEKRQILVNANEDNRKSIEELNRKVLDTEAMINQGASVGDIQAKLTEIERKTLAMKKEKEATALSSRGISKQQSSCIARQYK